jgi:hypothetical protein
LIHVQLITPLRSLVVLAAAALVAGGCTSSVDGTAAPQSAGNPTGPAFPGSGTIDLTLTADRGAADGAVVSLGVPFPPGALRDDKLVSVLDPAGTAVAIHTESLARWAAAGSVRSVLVAFRATLDANAGQKLTVEYGLPAGGGDAGPLAPNPDGPVIATLTARHYAASRVSGVVLPKADNVRFKQYDDTIAAGGTEKPLQDYGLVCSGGAEHRTYYDGTHARYQRGLRSGEPAELRAAHDEAVWYRANESSGSTPSARSRSPSARRWSPACRAGRPTAVRWTGAPCG